MDFYRDAYDLALEIHRLTLGFPGKESQDVADQIRRSSKSIPRNIAEGWGRRSAENDFKRFLLIAIGSCDEVRVDLDFCRDLELISLEIYQDFSERYDSVGKRMSAFRTRWKSY